MTVTRRHAILGGIALSATIRAAAADQSGLHGKTLRFIVPFAAGGPTDTVGRLVANGMQERLGCTIVIENVPGTGGGIGMERLSRSAPDGLTIGLGSTGSHAINPHLYSRLGYDPVKGFTPIAMLIEHTNMLVLRGDHPARNLAELLDHGRKTLLTYGSAGNGSSNHLSAELLAMKTGVKFQHVPFKGNGPSLTEVMSGRIDFMFDTPTSLPTIQGSGPRVIAVTSKERHSLLPDVPAVAETVPGYEVIGWFGLFAPAGLPEPMLQTLNDAVVAALQDRPLRDRLRGLGLDPAGGPPADLAERIQRDGAMWGDVMREVGVRPI